MFNCLNEKLTPSRLLHVIRFGLFIVCWYYKMVK